LEKIGLVTITYNSAHVLRGFLDSVLNQTFQNFVVYIIDNNSEDETFNILKEYSDDRIVIIKNTENVGVAKENNQGIKIDLNDKCTQV